MRLHDVSRIPNQKDALREQFRRYRDALSKDEYDRLSMSIIDRAMQLPEIERARTVHMYWPMVRRREVDTRTFIRRLEKHDKNIVLPRVIRFDAEHTRANRLIHIRYPGEKKLVVNRWGIFEPPPGAAVSRDELDAVVVPVLGAGGDGHRIGYGFGYYDEFLASLDIPKIGLVYAGCLLDTVPFDDHDQALDILVTENEVVRITSM